MQHAITLSWWRLLLGIALVLGGLVATAGLAVVALSPATRAMSAQAEAGAAPGLWECDDNSKTTLVANAQASTYRVWLADDTEDDDVVQVLDDQGHQVGNDVPLEGAGTSVDVGVPAGGSLRVKDQDSLNKDPAKGSGIGDSKCSSWSSGRG